MREEILAKSHKLEVTKIALRPEAQKKVQQESLSYDMISNRVMGWARLTSIKLWRVSKRTLLMRVSSKWVKWHWCAEMFGWHIKQKEVVEECLLREAFQWPVKGVNLVGLIRICLDFWTEAGLLCSDALPC